MFERLFEKAACDLFEKVFAKDELKAYQMLFVRVEEYNNQQCIKLAEWAGCRDFLSIKDVIGTLKAIYFYGSPKIMGRVSEKVSSSKPSNAVDPFISRGHEKSASENTPCRWQSILLVAIWYFKMPFIKFVLYQVGEITGN